MVRNQANPDLAREQRISYYSVKQLLSANIPPRLKKMVPNPSRKGHAFLPHALHAGKALLESNTLGILRTADENLQAGYSDVEERLDNIWAE
jgi:hypothetical protein